MVIGDGPFLVQQKHNTHMNPSHTAQYQVQLQADHLQFIAECILMMQGGNLTPEAYRLLSEACDKYKKAKENRGRGGAS